METIGICFQLRKPAQSRCSRNMCYYLNERSSETQHIVTESQKPHDESFPEPLSTVVDLSGYSESPLSESCTLPFQGVGSGSYVYITPFCLPPSSWIPETPESRWVRFNLSRFCDLEMRAKLEEKSLRLLSLEKPACKVGP